MYAQSAWEGSHHELRLTLIIIFINVFSYISVQELQNTHIMPNKSTHYSPITSHPACLLLYTKKNVETKNIPLNVEYQSEKQNYRKNAHEIKKTSSILFHTYVNQCLRNKNRYNRTEHITKIIGTISNMLLFLL